jgi:hypothetical protein
MARPFLLLGFGIWFFSVVGYLPAVSQGPCGRTSTVIRSPLLCPVKGQSYSGTLLCQSGSHADKPDSSISATIACCSRRATKVMSRSPSAIACTPRFPMRRASERQLVWRHTLGWQPGAAAGSSVQARAGIVVVALVVPARAHLRAVVGVAPRRNVRSLVGWPLVGIADQVRHQAQSSPAARGL